ncbi:peptidoglycan-binding protein, partial [Rhodopseudomonas sp. BAL398]|uniref:peptidoglycan-binding domain-containing protein n=1 Tax=Rhodopseudomonas sp. BAL398 TaxID=3034676 RepID=UPI0023E1CCBF
CSSARISPPIRTPPPRGAGRRGGGGGGGCRPPPPPPPGGRAPAAPEGPAFLMLKNFRVILHYNPAEAYALAIGHFADRLRGGAPFVQPWPRQERVLSRTEKLELQQLLAQRGLYDGRPDGRFGSLTRKALRGFQASIGAPADGFATTELLQRLRGR